MQPTAEISHKIRLAIKTKLTELGAYVDDELPDYVLVMVANRRGRQDMKKELELFLGEATDRFCSWLFGVLDKLKDAKKNTKDKKQSDNEQDAPKGDHTLDDYDDEEIVQSKKNGKNEKKIEKDPKKDEKLKRDSTSSAHKSSKSPTEKRRKSQKSRRTRSRSHSRSRSRSKEHKRTKEKNRKERSHSRERKKKDKRRRSLTPEAPKSKKKESKIVEPDKPKKKVKGSVKSAIVMPTKKDSKEKVPKPTSNLIIRAINESSSTNKTGLMRKITVNVGANNKSTSEIGTGGTKRKSKSGTEPQEPDINDALATKQPKRSKQADKRVFVTKIEDPNLPEKAKNNDNSSKNGKRAKSPKFFVTLHDPDKNKDSKATRKNSKGAKELIINPRDSEDSDPESVNVNDISAISAEKIRRQQEQNTQQLTGIANQSVSLNLSSLADSDPDARTAFVSGLDYTVGESELQEHFGTIGQIIRITVIKDRITGYSKGCAYIQYATVDQKKTACLVYNDTDFHAQKISVGDKMAPGQLPYVARANITAFPKTNYPRPAKDPKYTYAPGAVARTTKYQWTKPGFMPPR